MRALAALVLFLLPVAAMAQSGPATIKIIDCLEIAKPADGADIFDRVKAQSCIGAVFASCEAEGAITTAAITACFQQERAAWQELSVLYYGFHVNAARDADRSAGIDTDHLESVERSLEAAQDKWRRYIRSECAYRSRRLGTGTAAKISAASCFNELLALRAIDLLSGTIEGN